MKIVNRFVAVLMAMAAFSAVAQTWPSKPVRIILGQGPGGINDVIMRTIGDEMSKRLGQPVLVDNRVGANGLIAATAVKRSPPDGYTLYGGSATPFTAVFMKENMDASKELQPVSIAAIGDWFIYARSDLNVSSLKDLAAAGKRTRLKFAGLTGANHALMSLIAKELGFEYDNIPYKATDQTITAMIAGESDFTINAAGGFPPHIQSGKLRAIATLAPSRTPLMPDVATAKEQGVNFDMRFNSGIWAPLGTPRDVIDKLGTAIADAVKSSSVAERIRAVSMVPTSSTPDELARTFLYEVNRYRDAMNQAGLQPQ